MDKTVLLPDKNVCLVSHKEDIVFSVGRESHCAGILSIPTLGNLYAIDYLKKELRQYDIAYRSAHVHHSVTYLLFDEKKKDQVLSIVPQLKDKFVDYHPWRKQKEISIDIHRQDRPVRKVFDREYIEQEI